MKKKINLSRNKAIFLDRDGTISEEIGYYADFIRFKPIEGSIHGLKNLIDKGYLLIIITNQSGIARGLFTEKEFINFTYLMKEFFSKHNIKFNDILYCPHHPDFGEKTECECRKPKTRLVEIAVKKHNIDITKSYFIGDNVNDMILANKVGIKSILVRTGYGEEISKRLDQYKIHPDFTVQNLLHASLIIK